MKSSQVEAAIAEIHHWHAAAIQRHAYRMLGSVEESRDVTQEAFARLCLSIEKGVRVENPQAWLYRVVANLCHDRLRDRKHLQKKAPWIFAGSVADNPGMEAAMIRRGEIVLLRRCLENLSRRDRTLLLLYADGLSYAQMGEAAGIRKTSVGKILSRALARLRRKMNQGDVP